MKLQPAHLPQSAAKKSTDLLMVVVVLIWGANFTVVKLALEQFPPLVFTALRFALAVIALTPILWLREGKVALPWSRAWRLIVLGVIGNTFYQICFIFGLSLTTAANSALLVATTPALVALLGAALGIERITRTVGSGTDRGSIDRGGSRGAALLEHSRRRHINFRRNALLGDLHTWRTLARSKHFAARHHHVDDGRWNTRADTCRSARLVAP